MLYTNEIMDVHWTYDDNRFMAYVTEIIILYILNL